MADNPITVPLPADLPTDWTYGQTVSPGGTEIGLTVQHGYNYLSQQINAAQQATSQIGEAFSDLPTLGSDGKIPEDQLPEMNYDPSGSAAVVQENLDAHVEDNSNPHNVTAEQVGAYSTTETLQASTAELYGLDSTAVPNDVFEIIQPEIDNANENISAAIADIKSLQTIVQSLQSSALTIATGSYAGTDTYGASNPNSLTFSFVPKLVIIMNNSYSSLGSGTSLTWCGQEGSTSSSSCVFTLTNKTLSWYGSSAIIQVNSRSFTYQYFAIG